MSPAPSIRKLQYMLVVARELHFRKAAEKLRVAQPSISRQVRDCEEDVGFQILERDHHFVSLTKAGRMFVEDVDQILKRFENDLERAILRGQAMSRRASSECIIALSSFASLQVRRIVLGLREGELRPFDLRLRILPTNELLNEIEGGIIRAGITFEPIAHSVLSTVPLGMERWVAVVPSRSRLATLREVSVNHLRGATLISNGANRSHPDLFQRLVAECGGTELQFVAEVTSPSEACDLVRSGVGIALLPQGVCEELPEGVAVLGIYDIAPLQRVLVYRREDREFATALVKNILRELEDRDPVVGRKGPAPTSISALESVRSRPQGAPRRAVAQ
jgi:DNA-binding transcriptional LysR family regulator